MDDNVTPSCLTCKKNPPEVSLKRCAKCRVAQYCSRECQRANWKIHKLSCDKQVNVPSAGTRQSPEEESAHPFLEMLTGVRNGTYLHNLPEADVYRLLIDAYRLRVEDDYVFGGELSEDSLYGGDPNFGLGSFRRFLCLAATRTNLLPPWWNSRKKAECEKLAMDPSNWSCLQYAVEKSDIVEHYDNPFLPMQLRMLAEQVYGRGAGCYGYD